MLRLMQRALHMLPLLGALLLVGRLSTTEAALLNGTWPVPWRLDALVLVFMLGLSTSVALLAFTGKPPALLPWRDTLRALLALALVLTASVLEHLLALPLALLLVAGLLRSWRWAAAAGVLLLGLAMLRGSGATTWQDPIAAAALVSPVFLLLATASCVGLPCYPAALVRQRPDSVRLALQPIWLLPLLRTFEWGPWNSGWSLALVLLGGATALWTAGWALWTSSSAERVEGIAGTWQGLALGSLGLATPVGAASALWLVLVSGLGLALLQPDSQSRSRWSVWAAPLPPSAIFVAGWLAQGAAAASGAFLLASALWLATMLSGLAVLRLVGAAGGAPNWTTRLLVGFSVVLGVLAPAPLRWLIMPAVELLQGGLTPFGLLDIWPWVGIAALDSGQRRVAVLPSIGVTLLAVVSAALVWLVARLLGWLEPAAVDEPTADSVAWAALRQHVWWARGIWRRE